MKRIFGIHGLILLSAVVLISSCGTKKSSNLVSSKTGWAFNDRRMGGFDVPLYEGQYLAPGMVFVEGGRFTMGQTDEDLMYDNNNVPHAVTVSSFFMDETEVANVNYREYTYWLGRTYFNDYPEIYQNALPDTQCWRKALQYNETMVERYFRDAAYNNYPVVGVSWEQANAYCKWRTDRINELILIKRGYLKKNAYQISEENFNTKSYIAGQYEGSAGVKKRDLNPTGSKNRNVNYEDGILIAPVRLPTEAEWEYAALGMIAYNPEKDNKRRIGEEVNVNRPIYPWADNLTTRETERNAFQGRELANFMRGAGDAMGVAGGLNDNSSRTAPVNSYKPNGFGLYNMAGNVSEWVLDVYRPNTISDGPDADPFRGNIYDTYITLEDYSLEEKDSAGAMQKRLVTPEELARKHQLYREPNVVNYIDGDSVSGVFYDYGNTTLINDSAHVYKGGSYTDRAYWLAPGTRRFLQARHCSPTIGFRCAQDRLGSPSLKGEGGHYFRGSKKKSR
ncbi:MAG: SUMF1/EgtB/PvdO family nonheme iron enzyme [Chitinophagaceae bacterium]|nr:SUMF1/EgtB/PvdO family nonheme iron enzyme [Chitinophagaceae bacterium]